jgi:hypothetical protein
MKKIALRHFLDTLLIKYPKQFRGIDLNSVEFYLDMDSDNDLILKIINEGTNYAKFVLIVRTLLLKEINTKIYKREDDSVYAMRITDKANNSRIYCKDYNVKGKRVIVMSRAIKNKTVTKNKDDASIIAMIEAVKSNVYILKQYKDE